MATTQKKSQSAFVKSFGAFIRRFHMIIFFVFLVACVSVAVLLINKTLTESAPEDYSSSITPGTIDQATLERVQSLHTSNQPSPAPTMPDGRVNPFAE